MKIDSELMENHQMKLMVETSVESFEEAKRKAAHKLAGRTKIPGFRPGKVPYTMIVRHLGENAIVEEALDIYILDIYPQALKEAKIEPYGPGELDKIVSLDPPQLEFIVPLKPIVVLGDYKSVHIDYDYKPATVQDIENVITDLRERQAVLEPTGRPAVEGDIVYLKISGTKQNATDSSNTYVFEERKVPIIIHFQNEENLGNEWPYPGFSRNLIGLSVGDRHRIEHEFPEDFYVEKVKGLKVVYDFTVEEIKYRRLPELDDEFAQSLGEYDDLDALRNAIQAELIKNQSAAYQQEYDDRVLDTIIDQSEIKYPPQMLKNEIDSFLEQLKGQLAEQNSDLDLYLKSRDLTMEQLLEEIRPLAEARLKKILTILELSRAEDIKIKPDDLQPVTPQESEQNYNSDRNKQLFHGNGAQDDTSQYSDKAMGLLVKRTLERIREIAMGNIETLQDGASEKNPTITADIKASDDFNSEAQPPNSSDENGDTTK